MSVEPNKEIDNSSIDLKVSPEDFLRGSEDVCNKIIRCIPRFYLIYKLEIESEFKKRRNELTHQEIINTHIDIVCFKVKLKFYFKKNIVTAWQTSGASTDVYGCEVEVVDLIQKEK